MISKSRHSSAIAGANVLPGYSAKILLDSLAPTGERLTTMEVCFTRFVLAEFNTHRQFSRNSASSRAIPTSKLIERVLTDPVLPLEWGRNQPGMAAASLLDMEAVRIAERAWLHARDEAVEAVRELQTLQVHKQVLNRLLEPFLWHTVIVTATEWTNFFALRCTPQAQPEIREIALNMRAAYDSHEPMALEPGEWHTPLLQEDERDLDIELRKRVSAARCARVSYLTHDGSRDRSKDIDLCERLMEQHHLSPFEHVATPAVGANANFRGWRQMRAEVESLASVTR